MRAQQQNKYMMMMKDSKRITEYPYAAMNRDKFSIIDKC